MTSPSETELTQMLDASGGNGGDAGTVGTTTPIAGFTIYTWLEAAAVASTVENTAGGISGMSGTYEC